MSRESWLDKIEEQHRRGKHDRANGGPHPDCVLCQRAEQPRIDALAVMADELSAHLRKVVWTELGRAILVLREEALALQVIVDNRPKDRESGDR